MKAFKLKVTKEIIKSAKPKNTKYCMIAKAIRQDIAGAQSIVVQSGDIRFNLNGFRYFFSVPTKAAQGIIQFDKNRRKVKPFSFSLVHGHRDLVKPRGERLKPRAKSKTKARPAKKCDRRYHGVKVSSAA